MLVGMFLLMMLFMMMSMIVLAPWTMLVMRFFLSLANVSFLRFLSCLNFSYSYDRVLRSSLASLFDFSSSDRSSFCCASTRSYLFFTISESIVTISSSSLSIGLD
jgi:hypothetical protein